MSHVIYIAWCIGLVLGLGRFEQVWACWEEVSPMARTPYMCEYIDETLHINVFLNAGETSPRIIVDAARNGL